VAPGPMTPPAVLLSLPFTGRWLVQNSPARRVPSHGTDLLGSTYAIDFVGVDAGRATAHRVDWRTFLATEPSERFVGFGRPILAPTDGEVVVVHDGEPDHEARRSWRALPYLGTQRERFRLGPAAVAGNHVGIALADGRTFVFVVHLRRDSVRVAVGDPVRTGQVVGGCGNSGNSTQPHVHVQATDDPEISRARGVPVEFRGFREEAVRGQSSERSRGVPAEGSVVEPLG
jgi:Peptidase family M23